MSIAGSSLTRLDPLQYSSLSFIEILSFSFSFLPLPFPSFQLPGFDIIPRSLLSLFHYHFLFSAFYSASRGCPQSITLPKCLHTWKVEHSLPLTSSACGQRAERHGWTEGERRYRLTGTRRPGGGEVGHFFEDCADQAPEMWLSFLQICADMDNLFRLVWKRLGFSFKTAF